MNSQATNPMADSMAPLTSITSASVTHWILTWLADRDYTEDASFEQDTPFAEMGLSSIDAVELAAGLSQASGVALDSTIAWHYPTPVALAAFIADSSRTAEVPGAPAPVQGADLEHLDDQEMAKLLEQLLGAHSPPR